MKSRPKREYLLLPKLLQKLAPRVGARVVLEPRWGIVGQIIFKDGQKRYFRYNTLDLNPVGASDVARDKDYANFFMRKMGYPTVPGRAFFRPDWAEAVGSNDNAAAALRYATRIGFPVFVKPNSGSQGKNVSLVWNARELRRALKAIFLDDRVALVQKPVAGRDYRIVVLDEKIISAYERIPLNVIGDGRSNIEQLLRKKQREFAISSRDTRLRLNDPRIAAKLRAQGRALGTVAKSGEQVFLLDNANLSSGGDAVDVTRTMHPSFNKLAIKLTRDMGLRLCGVDIMVSDTITKPPKMWSILEVNAAPGLDHYVKTGKAQQKMVEAMYLKVLRSLKK